MPSTTHYAKHILVIRLSALGDVAIMQPVVLQRAMANPNVLFTVAAPRLLEPLFAGVDNIRFLPTAKKQSPHELYKHLAAVHPSAVADLHWVNRVIVADLLFRLHGITVAHIDKQRSQRRKLVKRGATNYHHLRPSWQSYDEVFDRLGLASPQPSLQQQSSDYISPHPTPTPRIGIAPFAQHRGKIWPAEQMLQLIDLLAQHSNVEILLFGGANEAEQLQAWAAPYDNVVSTAGKQSFQQELKLISSLSLMVSMDSANMHFASCLGIPVVSIWGATHPYGGFEGWRQDPDNIMQASLPCRPCSMYGRKACRYGDYRCLTHVQAPTVYKHIISILQLQ